jgi:hypothetical protein
MKKVMKKKLIKVTARDIEAGDLSAESCPVAYALARAFKQRLSTIEVAGPWMVNDRLANNGKEIKLPKQVSQWVKAYDRAKPVKPFSFVLEY